MLRAGERELLCQYRWQCAVCSMKRAITCRVLSGRWEDGSLDDSDELRYIAAALRGGREWLHHLRRHCATA